MKMLVCDLCGLVIVLQRYPMSCICGKTAGVYLSDDNNILIHLNSAIQMVQCRAIAIASEFVLGKSDNHRTWVIPRDHPKLWYYIEDTGSIINSGKIR